MGVQLDTGGGSKSLRPNINVTPLVDVVLVLLIIFMVVIPNMQEHETIELFPTTTATEDADEEKTAIVVTITYARTYHLGKDEIERDALLAALSEAHAQEPDRQLMIRGDKRLPYGVLRSFFYESKEIGFKNVKLAVGSVAESDLGLGALGGA